MLQGMQDKEILDLDSFSLGKENGIRLCVEEEMLLAYLSMQHGGKQILTI